VGFDGPAAIIFTQSKDRICLSVSQPPAHAQRSGERDSPTVFGSTQEAAQVHDRAKQLLQKVGLADKLAAYLRQLLPDSSSG
jgi:hypothetical protein